eukprot:TRINITY_DN55237_c0_g1_i1.p1 TRINITY_DN55237_c0_g1~~TRINITY_DN55237_c0_g1_i1.p1  ORF type:complete len:779 (-),score=121.08 TRINITY_DN55237_c0_g1_i1:10-2274(-)
MAAACVERFSSFPARMRLWRQQLWRGGARQHLFMLPAITALLVSVRGVVFAVGQDDGEAPASKSSEILETLIWCTEVRESLDWSYVMQVAKKECFENEDENALMRIKCNEEAVHAITVAAQALLSDANEHTFGCANGIAFVFAVALVYGRQLLSRRESARAQVLLWRALQDNFMMDATIWPVKTHDILQIFDDLPATLQFPSVDVSREKVEDVVTFLVPRCPPALAAELQRAFPRVAVFAGLPTDTHGSSRDEDSNFAVSAPASWKVFNVGSLPVGTALNQMLEDVETPFSLVVIGSGLPRGLGDLWELTRVVASRRVLAAGGPLVDKDRVYSDFCHKLRPRHYHLRFDTTYEHSIIFDEASRSSVRGSWFHEVDTDTKQGPCKLCDTLPPTFLARTDTLYAMRFHPKLDGEWALLDFGLRASQAPLVERQRPSTGRGDGDASAERPQVGWRHAAPATAVCPFVGLREVKGLEAPHLYGRREARVASGVAAAAPWFGRDGAALGPASSGAASGKRPPSELTPETQFALFMQANDLREFVGPDGITRHAGCNLASGNCPVPTWVYRGWAIPPCCKETMRHLLFYIADVFKELGIRYIVTDGVLLGSFKYGGMLDWDADVDLHIHNDDFWRLENEVTARAQLDGHYIRKHVNNNSFLLQANEQNYLLIELNKRREYWDPDKVWYLPVEGRLFPAMENAHLNLSAWYGTSFFQHRLRHVPEWEEELRPMYCATPYHYNCVDATQVPSGSDCKRSGIC